MSDKHLQQWHVAYDERATDELLITAKTPLDAAKDFALQRPNSGIDCNVNVRHSGQAGSQKYKREHGVWREVAEALSAVPLGVGRKSSIGVNIPPSGQQGLTITSIRLSFRDLFPLFGKLYVVALVYAVIFGAIISLGIILIGLFVGVTAANALSGR